MASPIIIEYGNRATRQPTICKFEQDSISIGRGYDNDLIMPNRYIAAEQFTIIRNDDAYTLEIHDQTNTVKINGRRATSTSVTVNPGDKIHIGHIEFRLHDYDMPLPPTRSLGWTSRLENHVLPVLAIGLLALLGAESIFSQWLYQLGEVRWQPMFNEALLVMGFTIVWAGGFSLLGRLLKHEAHYAVQLLFTALVLLILTIGESFIAYLSYYSGADWLFFVWNWLCEPVIISLLVYVHFKFATMLARPFLWAALLTCSLCGVLYSLENGNSNDFSYRLEYEPLIKAPFLDPFNSESTTEFISSHKNLVQQVRKEIEDYNKENPIP